MAVKRVILQHFSMKYDYMTKERPNIYQPSRAKFQLGADDDDDISKMKDVNDDADEEDNQTRRGSDFSSTGSGSEESVSPQLQPSELMPPPPEPPSKAPMHNGSGSSNGLSCSGSANNTNWRSVEESPHHQHNRSLDTSTNSALLDSIIELKEKLPDTYKKTTTVRKISDGGQQQQRPLVSRGSQYASNGNVGFYAPSNRSNVAPTVTLKGVPVENWRYRSSNSSAYRSGRQSGNNNYGDTVPYGGGVGGGRRQRYNNGQGVGGGYNSYHCSTNNTSQIRNWRNECMNNSASRNCNMAAASAILGSRRGPRGSLIEVDRRGSDASDVSCEYLGVGLSPPSESLLMQRRLRLNSRSSDIGPLGISVPQVQTVSG